MVKVDDVLLALGADERVWCGVVWTAVRGSGSRSEPLYYALAPQPWRRLHSSPGNLAGTAGQYR